MRFIYTKTFTKIFTIFVIVALLIVMDMKGYLGLIKDGFFRVFNVVQTPISATTRGFKTTYRTLFTIKNLVRQNSQLSQEVNELAFNNARLLAAQQENIALRKALGFSQQTEFNLLPAQVLLSDPTGFTQSVVIDKGESAGLRLNQPVVVGPGILVGKISKLYPNSAEVILLTDPSIVVNGEVAESGARGLVRGEHGLGLTLDLVTQNELIKSGDEVITSGLSGDFPRGLLIGDISALRSSATDLFQKAYIAPAADLRNLKFLFVVQ